MNTKLLAHVGVSFLTSALLIPAVSAQNVGIGTTTPQSKLSVNGSTASGGLAVGGPTYTSTPGTVAPLNGAIIQGFTGIGTSNPAARLNLEGNGSANWDSMLYINSNASPPIGTFAPHVVLRVSNNAALNPEDVFGRYIVQSIPGGVVDNPTGWDAIHRGFSGSAPLTAMRFTTCGGAGAVERMRIAEDGNIGIGTLTPIAPLHVARSTGITETNVTQSWFVNNTTTDFGHLDNFTGSNVASAIFQSSIWSGGAVVAFTGSLTASDVRFKNVIGRSDSGKDLATLERIEVTDYTLKDKVKMGNAPVKKVIAQQVEAVYPEAVKTIGYKGFTFTPDVYQVSSSVKPDGPNAYTVSLAKAHGLKSGETVRLITEKNTELDVVAQVVNETTFTATTKEALGDKVFVYGKQCLDLKSVDYDAIGMLNVSATQELAKKSAAQESKIAALESEVARLRAANDKLASMATEIEALKQAMAGVQKNGSSDAVRTVALTR